MNKKAIYPGSFDPITYGHIDIVVRAENIFEQIIIAILKNPIKDSLFSVDERIEMIKAVFAGNDRVKVQAFDGLLVNFAKKVKANAIIRGLRAISDFEYEFQMALMNRKLSPELETVFLMPREEYTYLSSRLVKEIALLKGNVHGFVPEIVEKKLEEKLSR
jgi:pantetheine-phosphate adenylyltransferase